LLSVWCGPARPVRLTGRPPALRSEWHRGFISIRDYERVALGLFGFTLPTQVRCN